MTHILSTAADLALTLVVILLVIENRHQNRAIAELEARK